MESVQEIIDKLDNDKKYGKNSIKINDSKEESYLKEIIIREKNKNKNISSYELSTKLGVSKDFVESVFEEILEKSMEKDKIKPKKEKKFKNFLNKHKEKTKKLIDEQDVETLKDFFLRVFLFGIPINISMTIISKGFFPINFYSWIGWGCAFWFLKKEGGPWLRGILHK